jgi:hypothetical protein
MWRRIQRRLTGVSNFVTLFMLSLCAVHVNFEWARARNTINSRVSNSKEGVHGESHNERIGRIHQ